jgi:hypothetical protein
MAIDLHDEAAARALLGAAEADTSPIAQKFHGDVVSDFFSLVFWPFMTPLLFGISAWRLTTALQTGMWNHFWWASIGTLSALCLTATVYSLVTPANPMASLAYSALREVAESSDERLAPLS